MKVSCILCNKQMETKNENVTVTVNWVYKDLAKRNNLQYKENTPRIVKICKKCWENTLKDKPEGRDYYWTFVKDI